MMIQIQQMTLGPVQTNCYLLGCEESMTAAIIDPSDDGRGIVAAAEQNGWDITHILLTHTHFDHVGGLADVKELTKAPIYAHPDSVEMLRNAAMSAALWGFRIPSPPAPDVMVNEGDRIQVGNLRLEVLYVPGHAPGHVAFHLPDYRVIFSGDVLFEDSIGRTDLPGSDHATLMKSIRTKLLTLPDDTRVFSGHGAATTIGQERWSNPFLEETAD
jgi:hydroxyacylglutathione hydrolase